MVIFDDSGIAIAQFIIGLVPGLAGERLPEERPVVPGEWVVRILVEPADPVGLSGCKALLRAEKFHLSLDWLAYGIGGSSGASGATSV